MTTTASAAPLCALYPLDLAAPGFDCKPPEQDGTADEFDHAVQAEGNEQQAPRHDPRADGHGRLHHHPQHREDLETQPQPHIACARRAYLPHLAYAAHVRLLSLPLAAHRSQTSAAGRCIEREHSEGA
jgi:hypothetical protein